MEDYAMKYEELLCSLFNCGQDGDELKLASATIYDSNIEKITNGEGIELRVGLFSALRKIQLNHIEGKYAEIEKFLIFWEEIDYWISKVFKAKSKSDINDVIDVISNILKEIEREGTRNF